MLRISVVICLVIAFVKFPETESHGRLMDPVGRASRWRKDKSAPADYDDNQAYCGGLFVCLFLHKIVQLFTNICLGTNSKQGKMWNMR